MLSNIAAPEVVDSTIEPNDEHIAAAVIRAETRVHVEVEAREPLITAFDPPVTAACNVRLLRGQASDPNGLRELGSHRRRVKPGLHRLAPQAVGLDARELLREPGRPANCGRDQGSE